MSTMSPIAKTGARRSALSPRMRELSFALYRLRRSPLAMIGLGLVALYVLVALLAPVIAPARTSDPYKMALDFAHELQPPSFAHPFGTAQLGVDVFYGVVWGSRISTVMGIGVVGVAALTGTLLGGIAGYYGGRTDEVIMRVTDIFLAMPILILAMGVSVALGPGLVNLGIAIAITLWPTYTRLVRGQVLSIRENQFVEAARAVGASDWRIIRKHVLPNAISPILVQATLDIGTVILLYASLSFIGFGPGGSDFAEWGTMVSKGHDYMQTAWWPVTIPGLAILGFSLGFNLLGDGLRDLLDPRLRK